MSFALANRVGPIAFPWLVVCRVAEHLLREVQAPAGHLPESKKTDPGGAGVEWRSRLHALLGEE